MPERAMRDAANPVIPTIPTIPTIPAIRLPD
jgi:hypothetical protein